MKNINNLDQFRLDSAFKPKQEEKPKKSRRDFLKASAIVGSGAFLGLAAKKLELIGGRRVDKGGIKEEEASSSDSASEEIIMPIKELIDFDQEKIDLSEEKMTAVKEHIKSVYINNPNKRSDLLSAYYRLGFWDPYLRDSFLEKQVPEQLRYLLIPESYARWRAESAKKAKGPYQFMPKTGQSYGLKSRDNGDHFNLEERYDPIKSARACATLLKDLHEKGNQDWNLALSGYNGGFYWRYLRQAGKNEEPSYAGFLKYMATRIGDIHRQKKQELAEVEKSFSGGTFEYRVKKGDTLRRLALASRVDIDQLFKLNNIRPDGLIRVGQVLKIPLSPENKEQIKNSRRKRIKNEFYGQISGFVQNLEYPQKYQAVLELIEEGFVKKTAQALRFRTVKAESKKSQPEYAIKKGDTLYSLAKRRGLQVKDLQSANPGLKENELRIGQKIIIPGQQAAATLRTIAFRHRVPLEKLKELNLAIIDENKEIPHGYEVRIPL